MATCRLGRAQRPRLPINLWFSPLEIKETFQPCSSCAEFVRRGMGLTVSFASAMHGMLFGAPVRCAHSCLIEHLHLVSRARAACSSCAKGKSCTLCMFPMCVTNVVWCARTCYQGARRLPACSPHNTKEITCQHACQLVCWRTHSTRVHPSCARARLSENVLVSMAAETLKLSQL